MEGVQRVERGNRRWRTVWLSTAAAVLTAAMLTACGGSSDPSSVVKTYLSAIANGDSKTACKQIDLRELNKLLESSGGSAKGTTCASLLTLANQSLSANQKQQLKSAQVGQANITGNTAVVPVRLGNGQARKVKLTQSSGRWLISGGSAASTGSGSSTPATPSTPATTTT